MASSTFPIPTDALLGAGRAILLGSFGIGVILSFREEESLQRPIERVIIGMLAMLFFKSGLQLLWVLGGELTAILSHVGPQQGLRDFVLESLIKAGTLEPLQAGKSWRDTLSVPNAQAIGANTLSLLNQVVRTGIWGVIASITEFFFLLVSLVLECARDVLWNILLIAFPVACGVYPVAPKILHNLALYAVEIVLWFPLLTLVDGVTSVIARRYSLKPDSVGLYIIAVEIVAIALILFIPALAHKCVHGGFSADLGVGGSVTNQVRRAVMWG